MINSNSIKTINYAIYPLLQFKTLLKMVKHEDYAMKHPIYFNSSIGSHVRHSFDHYNTILENVTSNKSSLFKYDKRKRETLVETDINASLHECEILIKQMSSPSILESIDLGSVIYILIYIFYNILFILRNRPY